MKRRVNKSPQAKAPAPFAADQLQRKMQQAVADLQQGRFAQARLLCQEILQVQPSHLEALLLSGIIAAETGDPHHAVQLFDRTIALAPHIATLYFNRGQALRKLNQPAPALADFDRAAALEPDYADTHCQRGDLLKELGQPDAALAAYGKAIALQPDFAAAYNGRGAILQALGQASAALASYDQAIVLKPEYAEAYWNRGNLLFAMKQPAAALAGYDQAVSLRPDYAEAYNNRGVALQALNRFSEALHSFDRAIALAPEYADAHYNRGNLLQARQQFEAALAAYDRAIAIRPGYALAHHNRGNTLHELNRRQAAIASYDQALAINPRHAFLHGVRLNRKMQICDWRDMEEQLAVIIEKIHHHEKPSPPFEVLGLSGSVALQRKAAEDWANDKFPSDPALGKIDRYPRHGKIRLGYFSMDFKNHPLAYLAAELFETHDRTRFEVIAFSFGPDPRDEMRQRLEKAFDRFIEVGDRSDKDIVEMARALEIDIAIDLAGFTGESRTGIFACRAAPVQVNFLGYPGTMGATYIDYLIADRQVIPDGMRDQYSEQIVQLPSFQPNDRRRRIADKVFTRQGVGLPPSGFVFCCFNYNYKITPQTFAGWMRILQRVDGSVLWLLGGNPTAVDNLRREAARHGVEAQRLVFAERLPAPEYLARYRCADLFLDTLPFNAGTTASDALWAGLPVLTCTGEAFAGRMATSLLTAIELPELITATPAEYEALAVELATNPRRLKAIKEKLERNRLTTLLFDSQRFTMHIEEAYTRMYERNQAELPPEHIRVEAAGNTDK